MYLAHFALRHKPFQISTDPRFLWLGEKHKEAFATLKYGVLDNKGFLLLTGDVGTGKTTLINALLKVLGSDVVVATVRDPVLNKRDFFNYIARAFGMDRQEFESKGDFLNHFSRFLNDSYYQGKKVLLIIDEAQRLKQDLLEEVRLLSNIEREDAKLLNIFFVGQNEFNSVLHRPVNRALRQRITVHYNIQPFTEEETGEYVRHRLKVAGAAQALFQPGAIAEVYAFSKGYPRLINIVSDRALLTGFVREAKTIDPGIVRECAGELQIPGPPGKEKTARAGNGSPGGKPPAGPGERKRPLPPAGQGFWHTVLSVGVLTSLILTILLGVYIFVFRERPLRLEGPAAHRSPASASFAGSPENLQEPEAVATQTAAPVTGKEQKPEPAGNGVLAIPPGMGAQPPMVYQKPAEAPPPADDAPEKSPTAATLLSGKVVIPFGHDSILPTSESLASLNLLAEKLEGDDRARIILRGYTDSSGNERYNQKLSEFRANAVKGYLVAKGIAESRITTIGAGQTTGQPGANQSSSALSKRRVEIEIVTD